MAFEIMTRAEARAQGLKKYFTGKPCARGHQAERFVNGNKCAECAAEDTAKWRAANSETWKASSKASKQRHQAKYSAKQRDQYRSYPAPFREAWARYYESKKPYHIARSTDAERIRRARKKGASGTHTAADVQAILSAQGHRCAYCRADLRKAKRHLDHIMPLALGGSNGPENLQWTCAPCNLSKGAKDPIEFARERGLLV